MPLGCRERLPGRLITTLGRPYRTRAGGVSARSVLMADVKDANATPDTVSVSLHDTPDGDDLASAQLDSAGAEGDKSRSGDADGGKAEADSPAALALAASAFIAEIGAELKASAERALSSEPSATDGGEGAAVPPEAALAAEGTAEPGAKGVGKSIHGKTDSSIGGGDTDAALAGTRVW